MSDVPVKIGEMLAGKYRVERVLGQGAMGVVVAARHVEIDRPVALKFILAHGGAAEEALARFIREAKAAAQLESEHAGKILDVGRLDGGAPYIVMELLRGKDLAAVLRERGPLPVDQALLYTLQAAHAIAEAHTLGIVHRDLKPANLFLTSTPADEPIVKVLDFGISKIGPEQAHLTKTGVMLGSPLYMSPEQMKSSRDVDERSDVWALGVTLFELLAGPGVTPFKGGTIYEVMTRVWWELPISLAVYRPDLPPGLVAVVMQCFEKDPLRRYPSVGRLVLALAPYVPPSAAIYVKRIADIQFDRTQASRPTMELPNETGVAREVQPAPASAMPAGTAPAPAQGTGSTTIPGLSRSLGPLLLGVVVFVLVAIGGVLLAERIGSVQPLPVASTAATTAPDVTPGPAVPSATVAPPPAGTSSAEDSPRGTSSTPTATPAVTSIPGRPAASATAHPKVKAKPTSRPGPTADGVDYNQR